MTTPAEDLRAAAAKLRELATAATPGPWRQHDTHLGQYGYTATVLSGEGNDTDLRAWLPSMSQEPWDEARNVWPDAAYIAAMHPGVGLALAELLEHHALHVDAVHKAAANVWHEGEAERAEWVEKQISTPALAVARAITGGSS